MKNRYRNLEIEVSLDQGELNLGAVDPSAIADYPTLRVRFDVVANTELFNAFIGFLGKEMPEVKAVFIDGKAKL